MIKSRKDIPTPDTWDLTSLYASYETWKKDLKTLQDLIEEPKKEWKSLLDLKDHLISPESLSLALDHFFSLERRIEKLYTYAHLFFDQDLANNQAKTANGLASSLFFSFHEKTSWLHPQILTIEEATLTSWSKEKCLAPYRFYLEKITRLKVHTLSEKEEKIIALAEKPLQTPYKSFSAFNNADIRFENAQDSKKNSFPLTQATYQKYLHNPDRELRKSSFLNLHKQYENYQNTLCEYITGQVENHLFQKKARNYSSSLESSLFPHHIDIAVYQNLLAAVKKRIALLHQYVQIRKDLLHLDTVHSYDLYAPIVDHPFEMALEDAKSTVIDSLSLLGNPYQEVLKKGLTKERWLDAYESQGKRSGGYSGGCFDSYPYILMNYQGTLNDVMTLAHEAGHSMHSYLSRKNQPYHYADYPIFVAEVASTFNEQLLMDFLLTKATSKKDKLYLLNHELEKIHATFFRQTLFAEFELILHELVEKGQILTPELLCETYSGLYKEYYGKDFCVDKELTFEWARIPHFYYNFYVYQYATGISAAIALFTAMKKGKIKNDQYLGFLKMGGSQYPLDELCLAGVDMRKPDPTLATMDYFSSLLNEVNKCFFEK